MSNYKAIIFLPSIVVSPNGLQSSLSAFKLCLFYGQLSLTHGMHFTSCTTSGMNDEVSGFAQMLNRLNTNEIMTTT